MNELLLRAATVGTRAHIHAVQPLPSQPRRTVSVIVPCYNYGHFLPSCVDSILTQTGVDVEVIVVDDASPDGSGEIVEKLAATDDRITAIRHPVNRGHIATYNDGFDRATGEYRVMLSADDLLTPGSLGRSVALMEAMPNVGITYGRVGNFYGEPPPATRDDASFWLSWSGNDWIRARCRSGFNVIATSEVVMRSEVMKRVGMYRPELPHSGDLEMWMRAATVSDVGYVGGITQALYRLHESNMHKVMFDGGTMGGQLIDLEERWKAFEMLFDDAVVPIDNAVELEARARRTLATQALNSASYAYARGFRDFPYQGFEDLAADIDPGVTSAFAHRNMNLRRRVGNPPAGLPVHPLWAPSAVAARLRSKLRTRRRNLVGV